MVLQYMIPWKRNASSDSSCACSVEKMYCSESGVSLLEFALVLPLLIFVVSAVLNIGIKIRTINTLNEVARHSVRVTSAYSRTNGFFDGAACGAPLPALSEDCPAGAVQPIVDGLGLLAVARVAACNHIKQNNLDPVDWTVAPSVRVVSEQGTSFTYIDVEVRERNFGECIFCAEKVSKSFAAVSSASQVLEGC